MEFGESILLKRTDKVKITTAAGLLTLHCEQCNAVLADSVGVCGELKSLDSVMCIRVTNDVVVRDAVVSGQMANCIYSPLTCRSCDCAVGKVIVSASSCLAPFRSIFLLHKANISCYILNSSSMVKASTISFDLKPLNETISEVRQEIEDEMNQIMDTMSRLADMSVASEVSM